MRSSGLSPRRRPTEAQMRDDLRPGRPFPDVELPDQNGERVRLSSLMRGYPTVVVFSRGYY